ncbi:hypothetical protein [Microvirga tunisiensis]|uniref:Uncharacterized protein n=1 Tax=Microvirga tunisiensis TaxID=2108360 RepID=A0A5N7N346_9HYPH|nr:hypothetical protein [Microvirga tunisiensis]MPR12190.1 hypothetical protein [Microvirga tunisiensis]MPR30136.1 hypothetical protein [Microvirga tunisiensis]
MRAYLTFIALLVGTCSATAQSAERLPGKPIAKPLPDYCQMGECVTTTVEYSTPVLFHSAGALFRVEDQAWGYSMQSPKKKSRMKSAGPSYVFCSKQMPAVIGPFEGKYMVEFLILDDPSRYGHSNEVSLAMYFAVCHSRFFDSVHIGGAEFARALGYKVPDRTDQPTINKPEEILRFLGANGRG